MKSSPTLTSVLNTIQAVVSTADVEVVDSKHGKEELATKLTELSSKTEMSSYGTEQWKYLLGAGDVTALVVKDHITDRLLGCVLKVQYGANVNAYGMMLVSHEARGQGLARRLLTRAMQMRDNDCPTPELHILGTCTEMGRPFYKKVGYERVATVRRMTVCLQHMKFPVSAGKFPDTELSVNTESDSSHFKNFLELDHKATGLDRSKTLRSLASYPYVSIATVTDTKSGNILLAALVTHHTGSSSIMVGPIIGDEAHVPDLLQAIGDEHAGETTAVEEMALIISDHTSLVETLKQGGFRQMFELGAMTLNGKSLPGRRELYLGLIHPTLG
eukprot:scaffold162_cov176-Amphora_coffeaeformis.AAC.44